MKKNCVRLNVLSSCLLGGALLLGQMLGSFVPQCILPRLNIAMIVGLTLLALLLEYFFQPDFKRSYSGAFVHGSIIYLLLPWAAGVSRGWNVLKYGAVGGVTFSIVAFLFDSMIARTSSPTGCRRSALANACLLYLAAQIFNGILL